MRVETATGAVLGRPDGQCLVFHGIPFAAAPVGRLRFAAPAAPEPWRGVRDCRRPGPGAPQPASRLAHVVGPMLFPQAEDCLTLNVWTPGTRGRRPVLFWVHGGGFSSGSGGQDWYSGAHLATTGDIVVVTVNYRLGALGFLYGAELGHDLGAGNLGLLDQIAALRWVGEHIADFGGDPDQVTFAGQSAGALSALALLPSGLFQRVILQSTPAVAPATPSAAAEVTERFLRALDLRPDQADRLRDLSVEQLINAQKVIAGEGDTRNGDERNGVVPRDGEWRGGGAATRLAPPFQLVASAGLVAGDLVKAAGAVPRLISVTRDEAMAFHAPPAVTEEVFHRHVPDLAAGSGSYVCRFDWHPDGNPLGACHSIELPFVFGTLPAWRGAPMLDGADPRRAAALSTVAQRAWIAFVRTGNPGWPAYADGQYVQRLEPR